ncbi:hypothetical protein GMLC_01220 [Geomonas limicola]|uniref:Uncharacterized protein n=1 Tax=Geomonas limicola TaxID=2740186 RepID=A0A6V8N4J9_9BACT|nr:hypothetical protein GMLC_01220 [Geomonas limicola]
MEFYIDGILQGSSLNNPYTFSWNTLASANGAHILTAKAYDAAGNVGVSSNVAVTVFNDTSAPTVSIVAPSSGSILSQTVTVLTSASDDVGVTKVEYYLDGTLQATATSLPYNFAWNTLSTANGSHTVSAKAYDAAGNVGQSASVTVSVFNDTTAPTVAISSPSTGSTIGQSATVQVAASDNVGVTKVEYYLNGTLQGSATSAPYTFSWNTLSSVNGTYTLSAKAYDATGNVGQSASVTVIVFNDTTPPSVSITSPSAGSTLGQTATVQIAASDNVAVTKVEYYLNGILQGSATSAPYAFSWNTLSNANGSYTVTAKAYDAAGNVGQSAGIAVTVFNDTSAPLVSLNSLSNGSVVSRTATIQVTASDNVGVSRVELYANGVLLGSATSAPYSFIWNTLAATNGSYILTAKAYDMAGNIGTSSAITVSVFNDVQAPTLGNFTLPANVNSTTVAITSLSASDNVAVAGYLISESATAPSSSAVGWNASAPTSFTFSGTGLRTAYAWAKDATGNVSAAKSASVLIDTTLPAIKSMSLSRSSSVVNIKASATDNVGVTKFQLYVDGVLKTEVASGSLSYSWTVSSTGTHTATVKAYDAAGNTRTQSVSFYR